MSNVAPPTEQRKKPLDQRVREWRPQPKAPKRLRYAEVERISRSSDNCAQIHSGGWPRRQWTWSGSPPNPILAQPISLAVEESRSRSKGRLARIFRLNFVPKTTETPRWWRQ